MNPADRPDKPDRPDRPGKPDTPKPAEQRAYPNARNPSRVQRATGVKEPATRSQFAPGAAKGRKELGKAELLARKFICAIQYFDHFEQGSEPTETEPNRSSYERTIDWTGLDSLVPNSLPDPTFAVGAAGAAAAFAVQWALMISESKKDGKTTNIPGRDKHYHCMANCIGNSLGAGGQYMSGLISAAKEVKDVGKNVICRNRSYGTATRDSSRDQTANRIGRDAGRSGERCADACSIDKLRFIESKYK